MLIRFLRLIVPTPGVRVIAPPPGTRDLGSRDIALGSFVLKPLPRADQLRWTKNGGFKAAETKNKGIRLVRKDGRSF